MYDTSKYSSDFSNFNPFLSPGYPIPLRVSCNSSWNSLPWAGFSAPVRTPHVLPVSPFLLMCTLLHLTGVHRDSLSLAHVSSNGNARCEGGNCSQTYGTFPFSLPPLSPPTLLHFPSFSSSQEPSCKFIFTSASVIHSQKSLNLNYHRTLEKALSGVQHAIPGLFLSCSFSRCPKVWEQVGATS